MDGWKKDSARGVDVCSFAAWSYFTTSVDKGQTSCNNIHKNLNFNGSKLSTSFLSTSLFRDMHNNKKGLCMICTIWHVIALTRWEVPKWSVWRYGSTHMKPYLDSDQLLGFRLLWELLQSNHCDWWQEPPSRTGWFLQKKFIPWRGGDMQVL